MIACPDCVCGGRRLVYRTVRGARFSELCELRARLDAIVQQAQPKKLGVA